jgi:hypothetical protein
MAISYAMRDDRRGGQLSLHGRIFIAMLKAAAAAKLTFQQ